MIPKHKISLQHRDSRTFSAKHASSQTTKARRSLNQPLSFCPHPRTRPPSSFGNPQSTSIAIPPLEMCHLTFARPSCGCPPYPCPPFYVLCEKAEAVRPLPKACPVGTRKVLFADTGRGCGLCYEVVDDTMRGHGKEKDDGDGGV